jgi:TolA-binding protein
MASCSPTILEASAKFAIRASLWAAWSTAALLLMQDVTFNLAMPGAAAQEKPAPNKAASAPNPPQGEINEKAMAAYADAANFQTNGAFPLAIEAWNKFLKDYPNEPLVAKASHYLGVCYMQQATPDYAAAADAFARAVNDPRSDVREESLINLGWCQFAAAGEGDQRDPKRLEASLQAFNTLIREKPQSKYLDRAMFYGGEAAYALGKTEEAIAFYDRLLALESTQESPLRCEAVFARGIALEKAGRFDDAMAAYRQVVDGCKDNQLRVDAKLRMGDASILQKKFAEAIALFEQVATEETADRPYALLRQAFALVQADRPAEASAIYERLLSEFPDSPHAAAATLASAQSIYRAGDMAEASKRFERVLSLKDPISSTESAHWLAMIALRDGKPEAAVAVAQRQLDAGAAGPYANTLKLDLAEATMLLPGKLAEAMNLFADLYRATSDGPEAPRALYNAAFAALQLGQTSVASELATEFLEKFPNDPLIPDVRYVSGEAELIAGDATKAAEQYQRLLEDPASQAKPQWPLWVIRAATAKSLAGQPDEAIRLLAEQRTGFTPAQTAEALFIAGSIHLSQQRGPEAIGAFEESLAADPTWQHANETRLQLGQALVAAGDEAKATETWQQMIQQQADSPWSDQARYRLALLAARKGDHLTAAERFNDLLLSKRDPGLIPAALYGRGWNLMRAEQPEAALAPLEQLIKEHENHPLASDARLAMGMCLRSLNRPAEATTALEGFLAKAPEGVIGRGHALYELALIDQSEKRPADASKRLAELVATVPNYPDLEKVLGELAWALKEGGQDDEAEKRFRELVERFPESPQAAEAHYFVGQRGYQREDWAAAATAFAAAAASPLATDDLREKALYRQGWCQYKAGDFETATATFTDLSTRFPEGKLLADSLLMIGEGHFKLSQFEPALAAYEVARKRIVDRDETEANVAQEADRQIRELVFLHGGQSLAQLKRWEPSIEWYEELSKRFPKSNYLTKARYETAYSLQQLGKDDEAIAAYTEVAEKERNDLGARSRFMIGEILFGKRDFALAIPEFQRVMYGYGAEKAPAEIRNWQAKSGYEAGRCAELMMQDVEDAAGKRKSAEIAMQFYDYVLSKHPEHELATKSRERLQALGALGFKLLPATTPPRKAGS